MASLFDRVLAEPTEDPFRPRVDELPPAPLDDVNVAPPLGALQIDEMEPPRPKPVELDLAAGGAPLSPPDDAPKRGPGGPAHRPSLEPARARAEEINPGSKAVPRIDAAPGDFFGLGPELDAWFDLAQVDVPRWLRALRPGVSPTDPAEVLHRLFKIDLAATRHVAALHAAVTARGRELLSAPNWVEDYEFDGPLTDFHRQTLLAMCLASAAHDRRRLLRDGVPVVANLLEQIAALRWDLDFDDFDTDPLDAAVLRDSRDIEPQGRNSLGGFVRGLVRPLRATHLARLFFLARLALLATFGESCSLEKTRSEVRRHYGLDGDVGYDAPAGADALASPIDYAAFMAALGARFPSHEHPVDAAQQLGARLRQTYGSTRPPVPGLPADPRELVSQVDAQPHVPRSIEEACALYQANVALTPAVLQLAEHTSRGEHLGGRSDHPRSRSDHPGSRSGAAGLRAIPAVDCAYRLYAATLGIQKSVVRVAVDFCVQRSSINHLGGGGPDATIHAALGVVWHLLRWFEAAHVLMFEHLAALVFDSQYHLFAHLFCSRNPRVAQYVLEKAPTSHLWTTLADVAASNAANSVNSASGSANGSANAATNANGRAGSPSDASDEDPDMARYNCYHLQTYTQLLGTCRAATGGKTQRLLAASELPVDAYKPVFAIYEKQLWLQTLQYLKSQVPYTGRRWRYLNMDIISAIYLHVPPSLDDPWLSGNDMGAALKTAPLEEETLRKMVLEFNEECERAEFAAARSLEATRSGAENN